MFEFIWSRVRTYPGLVFLFRRAAKRFNVSTFTIWRRALVLFVRYGFGPRHVIQTGLVDPALSPEVEGTFIGLRRLARKQRRFIPKQWECMIGDKAAFHSYCSYFGLPVPKLYAVFDKIGGWNGAGELVSGRTAWERLFENDLPQEFIVKPALGAHGFGVVRYRRSGAGFTDVSGRTLSVPSFYERLQTDSEYTRFVIQERAHNDPELRRLTGTDSLQTARITTWITKDGAFELYLTFFKFIIGKNISDNFSSGHTGNMIANIDPETGMLGEAIAKSSDNIGVRVVPVHPVTGIDIRGTALPHWASALQLAERAARLFLPLRAIGWDVALTPEGAVLIEGNAWWESVSQLVAAPHISERRRGELAHFLRRFTSEA